MASLQLWKGLDALKFFVSAENCLGSSHWELYKAVDKWRDLQTNQLSVNSDLFQLFKIIHSKTSFILHIYSQEKQVRGHLKGNCNINWNWLCINHNSAKWIDSCVKWDKEVWLCLAINFKQACWQQINTNFEKWYIDFLQVIVAEGHKDQRQIGIKNPAYVQESGALLCENLIRSNLLLWGGRES